MRAVADVILILITGSSWVPDQGAVEHCSSTDVGTVGTVGRVQQWAQWSSTGGQGDNWGTLETRGVASHLYYTLCYLSAYLCITTVLKPVPLPGL